MKSNADLTPLDRWNLILEERKKHAWGKAAGLAIATVDNIFSDGKASWEALRAAMYCDNVSPRWLAEGVGAPYIATGFPTSQLLATHIRNLLDEDGWSATLLLADELCCLVLQMPGQFSRGKKLIDYTILEVAGGPVSRTLIPLLQPMAVNAKLSWQTVPSKQLIAVISGHISKRQLIGDSEIAGLISDATPCSMTDLDKISKKENPTNQIDLDLMRAVIHLVEITEIEEGVELTAEQKSRVISAAYRHTVKAGTSAKDIKQATIIPLLDLA